MKLYFLLLITCVFDCDSSPVAIDIEYGDKFEGDIVISQEKIDAVYGVNAKSRRGVLVVPIWTDGVVYYRFDAGVKSANRAKILIAMEQISAVSCLQFRVRTTQASFITISAGM